MLKRRHLIHAGWPVLLVVVAFLVLQGGAGGQTPSKRETATPPISKELLGFAEQFGGLFEQVAAHVQPAVVYISSERTVKLRRRNPFEDSFRDDPFFRRFFGFPEMEREFKQRALGSGLIFNKKGYILTNNHVVKDADELSVKLADGRTSEAELMGADAETDLAVIKLKEDLDGLPVAELGDSDEVKVGQWVIAIGNPFGIGMTVSAGIISAKGRTIGAATYESMLQTDAAINRGNSGGPLVNLRGKVIGINTAIVSPTGTSAGLGFAIPINMAKDILDRLVAGDEIERGFLGIAGSDVDPQLAEQWGYQGRKGAIVDQVIPDTPAAEAGLQPGDIVLEWNGEEVDDYNELRRLVAATSPDQKATVKIWREGKEKTLHLVVTKRAIASADASWLGIRVQELTEEIRKHFARSGLGGVLVAEVSADGPAAGRISPGDIILDVYFNNSRNPVNSVEEFDKLVAQSKPEEGMGLRVYFPRRGFSRWVVIPARR